MKTFWLGLLLCLAVFQGQFAYAQLELRDDQPGTYTVVLGDTLWDISNKFLKTPWLWPEIWQANPQVANPHLIYPGDVLSLIYIDGKPRLVVNRGDVKLSPQMRTSPLGAAIPAIPLDAISAFLSRSRVVEKETLAEAPYVLAGASGRIISSAGDRIYARGDFSGNSRFYGIYRKGQTFKDPETREKLGIQAMEIGTGRIAAEDEEEGVTTILLNSSNEEVRVGDRFLAFADEKVNSTFYPKAPDGDVDGLIIAVEGGVANIGRYDVVVINRGTREGLITGDVLAVNQAGKTIRDSVGKGRVKLPSERAGLLIVFKVFDKVSYGLILEADRPLSVFDEVGNP
jgi:hypothetical protein